MNRLKRYEFVRTAINQRPGLSLKIVSGMTHRIMKAGINGSIWMYPKGEGFAITATGAGIARLYGEFEKRFGQHYRQDWKGYKYWHAEDPRDIEAIISIWAKIRV